MSKTGALVIAEQEARAARADGPDDRDYHMGVAMRALRLIADSAGDKSTREFARETLKLIAFSVAARQARTRP